MLRACLSPWIAPQFPLVGCTDVEAVTANNATLRHYGRKVVCGHVTTISGRRILIQITFGVMSVRKPLLSTSALKRRGVTIIFNHDYDRIIFRNETVHLISHDCRSSLHLTLASGIPCRKAMVMAGENVANDVDEEVYVGDGVVSQEAQEASAGDRRAIADADKAGQLDVSGETRAARALRTLEPPTDAARMVHNTTHAPFRDWCLFCVASRGRNSPHRRVVVNKTADTLPKFQADYMFIRKVAESKTQPCITFRCSVEMWCPDDTGRESWVWVGPLAGTGKVSVSRARRQQTELRDERNRTSTRTKALIIVAWNSSLSETYWREMICRTGQVYCGIPRTLGEGYAFKVALSHVDGPSLRARIREQFHVLLRTARTPHRRTCTFVNVLTKICIQPWEPLYVLLRTVRAI